MAFCNKIYFICSISSIVGVALMTFFFFYSFYSYRDTVLNLRKGIWKSTLPRDKFPIMASMSFVGCVISNFIVGFILVMATCCIIFIPLSCTLLWMYIYENLWLYLTIIITTVVNGVLMGFLNSYAANAKSVLNRA